MQKRELFNSISFYSGTSSCLRLYKKYSASELPILAYHRVINYDINTFNSDVELISSTPDVFEKQISYICKYYQPVTFKELSKLNFYKKNKKPPILITFDDGFIDNYQIVYPILKYFNIKATFFITTNAIDNQEPMWFDLLAYLIITCDKENIIVNDQIINLPDHRNLRRELIAKLLLDLRNISNEQRQEFIRQLIDQTSGYNKYVKENHLMSWSNIKEMSRQGMEFGSHSVSHPILAQMNDEEIDHEVSESKRVIENQLNTNCYVFAYPVGGFEEFNNFSKLAIKSSGYKFACTYEPGINKFPISDPYQLRRIHVERYTSLSTFKNLLISSVYGYK